MLQLTPLGTCHVQVERYASIALFLVPLCVAAQVVGGFTLSDLLVNPILYLV